MPENSFADFYLTIQLLISAWFFYLYLSALVQVGTKPTVISWALGLVNKPNISYRFANILRYRYGILQKSNVEIFEFRYQLQYRFERLCYSDDILMIDIQTDII